MTDATHDLALEEACLREGLTDWHRYQARGIVPRDYAAPKHQLIAQALEDMGELGLIEPQTVALHLQRKGHRDITTRDLELIGHGSGLVPDHERLKALRRLRMLKDQLGHAASLAAQGHETEALRVIADVDLSRGARRLKTRKQLMREALFAMERRDDTIRLGLPGFEHAIGPLPPGSLLVIGGDTNTCKTSIVLELLSACVAEHGQKVGLISIEDPSELTGGRLLSMRTGMSGRCIQRRTVNWAALPELHARIETEPDEDGFFYEDLVGENDLEVCATMAKMARAGARLVAVDYLQEVDSSDKAMDRRNEIRRIAGRLKHQAKKLGIALILVSQIARPKDGDANKEPSKHAIKESGDVGNKAEAIVMIWREQENDFATIHLALKKCKWGGVDTRWAMRRNAKTGRLEEVEQGGFQG